MYVTSILLFHEYANVFFSILGTSDFFSVNMYSSHLATPIGDMEPRHDYDRDMGVHLEYDSKWEK